MKRLLTGAIALLLSVAASATTLNPVQLLNPTGSTSGQAIVSTGASSAPAWGNVSATSLATQASNTVVANVTGSSASPTAFSMPSCSTSASALNWTSGTGFTCNASINAATLGGTTFAAPGAIGSTTASTGAFTTLSASSTVSGAGFTSLLSPYAPLASPTFTGTVTTAALTSTGLISPSSTNGIKGTTTNDNANAGSVGEFISSNVPAGSAVAYTSGTPLNITSISLTAGDWDVWGTVAPIPGTQITAIEGWVSTTSATPPTLPNAGGATFLPVSLTSGQGAVLPVGTMRLSIASTTTVFLSANIQSTASGTIYGFIAARRRR